MLTEIYDDLKGIDNVRIDMCIYDSEGVEVPSVFQCILKSGDSVMVIKITNDGTKTIRYSRMSLKSHCYRFARENSASVFSFLKSITKPTICALIGGSMGYIIKGYAGSVLGAGVGIVAKDKVVDKVLNYFDKQAIQHEQ